jgi:hypothetical protein
MGGNATQALKDYSIMTGTFWCGARAVCLPPCSRDLPSPPLRDNNSSWLRGLKFVLDTYAKSWGQIQ